MNEPKKYLDSILGRLQGNSWVEMPLFQEAHMAQKIKEIFEMNQKGEKSSVVLNKIMEGKFYRMNPLEISKELQSLQLHLLNLDFSLQFQEMKTNYSQSSKLNLKRKLQPYFSSLKSYFQEFYMSGQSSSLREQEGKLLSQIQKQIDQIECL